MEYKKKQRPQKIRMLDGSVKTVMVDDSKTVGELLVTICSRIGKVWGPTSLRICFSAIFKFWLLGCYVARSWHTCEKFKFVSSYYLPNTFLKPVVQVLSKSVESQLYP